MRVFKFLVPKSSSKTLFYKALLILYRNKKLNSLFFYNYVFLSVVKEKRSANKVLREVKLLKKLNDNVFYKFLFFFLFRKHAKFPSLKVKLPKRLNLTKKSSLKLDFFKKTSDNVILSENQSREMVTIFFKATSNNIFCGVVDSDNNLIMQCTSGVVLKFYRKKQKKVSIEVSDLLAKYVSKFLLKDDFLKVDVKIYSFFDNVSKSFLRCLSNYGITISKIINQVPVAHNGCRLKKSRRI